MRFFKTIILTVLLACATLAVADTITLKDGRKIEGVAIRQGEEYWVKTSDGESQRILVSDVASVVKGNTPAPAAPAAQPKQPGSVVAPSDSLPGVIAPPKDSPPSTIIPPSAPPMVSFNTTKWKADAADTTKAALDIWKQFIKLAPITHPDLDKAKAEFDRWKKLDEEGAKKVDGKWASPDDKDAQQDKAEALLEEAVDDLQKDKLQSAAKKIEQAAAIDPNSFYVKFLQGYLAMVQHSSDKALRFFEEALRIEPDTPAILSNMGVILCEDKKQYDAGLQKILKAAEIHDTRGIVKNLLAALAFAPPNQRSGITYANAINKAKPLAAKYGLNPALNAEQSWVVIGIRPPKGGGPGGGNMPLWSGTGFIISSDGLILTNRHVAAEAKSLVAVLPDQKDRRPCEVIAIDDKQDLALLRIKPKAGEKLTYARFAKNDSPNDGADVVVMGYPMIDELGGSIKVSKGNVNSAKAVGECDVLFDAKVNPGNSGGPIFDKFGNVMAIVAMKTHSSELLDSYGMGISAGRIRTFLKKNNVDSEVGATDGQLSVEDIAAKFKPATVCILALTKEKK